MKNAKEFVSEEEMRECLGEEARGYWGNYGYIPTSSDNRKNEEQEGQPVLQKSEPKNHFVGAYVNGSMLYVSKNGVTYASSQAKSFTKSEADKKAAAMTRKGNYVWKAIRKS